MKCHLFLKSGCKFSAVSKDQGKGVDMGIIRTAILLSGLAAFIPAPPEDANPAASAAPGQYADGAGYIQMATGTFSDLANFCDRQPGVCKTAGYVAYKLERKAKYGVRLIYEWANEAAPAKADIANTSDPIMTGSTKVADARKAKPASQSTLTIEDVIPMWLGPPAAKNG
jgi:hypothetical protein